MFNHKHSLNIIKAIIFNFMMVVGALSSFAFTYNGLKYNVISSTTVEVGENTSVSGDLEIPATVSYNGTTYHVVSISPEAFKSSSILTINLPNTLTSIKDNAFIECRYLKTLKIPNSVETIGNGSIAFCNHLESLDLGTNIASIGADIFTGLSSLKTVICRSMTPPSVNTWGTTTTDATLYVPQSAIQNYQTATVWRNLKSIYSLESRPSYNDSSNDSSEEVLEPFASLKELTFGNNVEEIETTLFRDNKNINKLTLGGSLKSIGANTFSGCTALTEVIIPPLVETIGASAFEGDSNLKTIIMGHSVKEIGDKAFNNCPAKTVSITAQEPPVAPYTVFSNYNSCLLYVQGSDAADAYYDSFYCWDRFDSYVMIEAKEFKYSGESVLKGEPGDTFQLTATLMPENVTLPQVFWRSTNPDIATVDENGLVTLHKNLSDVMSLALDDDDDEILSCKIIAESLYADGPKFEVEIINDTITSVDSFLDSKDNEDIDYAAPIEVYNLNGMYIGRSVKNLEKGIYIVRQGNAVKKITVK